MSSDAQWSDIENLFFEALGLPASERADWLAEAAHGREEVVHEVLTLLQAHEQSESEARETRVGAYRLERLIGRGGMGEVWLASRADGHFEQRVAIKLVRSGLGADLLLSRFQQERSLLARLNHPNIARLLDGGVSASGRPFLVMEYVEGEPIADFCKRHSLALPARIEMIRQLCGAVEYAHRNLIVHRDIKPGNVLVTADGSPKLLDFGIAKLLETDSAATATAIHLLTPRYASPEQLRGDPVTTASDVYSLGVLAFELITGCLPYELHGNSPAEIVSAIATQEPRHASRTTNQIPRGDLDAVLAKALEKEPAARYGSVDQFSEDLKNYLVGRPVSARVLTTRYRLGKYLRRHWAGAVAVAVVAVALATATAMSVRAARSARLEQARSARVTQFLEDMLGSIDPSWEGTVSRGGADTRVLDLLPAARKQIGTVFAHDPAAAARVHRIIARAYTNLQQYPDAETDSKAALALLPSLEDDPAEKARVLFTAGELDFRMSHRNEEERELRQALATFESSPAMTADAAEHAIYVTKLAEALADVGKREEAAQYADRGARLLGGISTASPVQTGIIHDNLALIYLKIGRLEPARAEARQGIEQLAQSPRPLNELSNLYWWLEVIDRYLGDLTDARTAAELGAQAAARAAGPNETLTVAPRIELAYMQALSGEIPRALPELVRCLAEARNTGGDEDLFHALHSLGYVLTLAGRAREGEPLLREALRTGAKFLADTGPSIGMCSLELGECLERQGRLTEARAFYQVARDNFRNHYGPVYVTRRADAQLASVTARISSGSGVR